MELNAKIFIAGHRGMVGGAIVKALKHAGYTQLVVRTSAEVDLRNQAAVETFFQIALSRLKWTGKGKMVCVAPEWVWGEWGSCIAGISWESRGYKWGLGVVPTRSATRIG